MGVLKKAATGVLAHLSCSRTPPCTFRVPNGLRPWWTAFLNPPHALRCHANNIAIIETSENFQYSTVQ